MDHQRGIGTAALKAVAAPLLEALKARLDEALGSLSWCLIWWLATLPTARQLELDDL